MYVGAEFCDLPEHAPSRKSPPTWNDAINAMSAEEKAEWICRFIRCENCPLMVCTKPCFKMWVDYFNSPYDGGKAQEGAE